MKREEVVVVSASRVESTLINAPATMSVISSARLAVQPAQNMADLLRAVPGLNVIQTSARDINLTARQATSTLAGSELVLVDGRSVYVDFFGFVLWDAVPSPSSGEIKQIEVVRGPASVVWGANAANGLVNVITKSPRESDGLGMVLGAGAFDRGGGSREREGDGYQLGASVSYAHALNDAWSYRLNAGYYGADPNSRPVGTIPLDCHPLAAVPCRAANGSPTPGGIPIGGASYPADANQPGGFENEGTSQPRLGLRVDHDLTDLGRIVYEGGYNGTSGIIHTGIGPFRLESGSHMAFGRVGYSRGSLRVNAYANFLDATAPNLLVSDPSTLGPILLTFRTGAYELEAGNESVVGSAHILTYGASMRHNDFDISLAQGPDRNDFGAYLLWEYFTRKFRVSAGGRLDKFSNVDGAMLSPRVSVMFKPTPRQSIRASYNRAFVAPNFVNNHLNQDIQYPQAVDLTPLKPLLGEAAALVPPPFLLTVNAFGNPDLKQQATDAFELAYTGSIGATTTFGLSAYQSGTDDNVAFTYLFPPGTPGYPLPTYYSVGNPARGVTVPTASTPAQPITLSPALMAILGQVPPQLGGPILLPEKAATYLNLGPLRNRGIEASLEHRIHDVWSTFANYSFQATPRVLAPDAGKPPYPVQQLGLPPTHRFNAGVGYSGKTFFGNADVNYASRALWVDVLSAPYAGYSDAYALLNASFGVKLADGKLSVSLKGTNLANDKVQQHVFGDVFGRSIVLELRYLK